jgi:transposase
VGEEVLGLSVEVVREPPKPVLPEKAVKAWAEEWAKEGKE